MYLTPLTPPGCTDTLDLDAGVWWRLRHLSQSDLIAEGISPLVSAVSTRPSNLPPSPEDQHRNALLSERLLAASVAAASSIPRQVWEAYRSARAALDWSSAAVAVLQVKADAGEDVAEQLAAEKAKGATLRADMEAARAAASSPEHRGEWKAVRVTCDPTEAGAGVLFYGDLPPSSLAVIAQAINDRREAAAERLRSFLE